MKKLVLTPAQSKIFELIHFKNKDIASSLQISARTVESHITNILLNNNIDNKKTLKELKESGIEYEVVNNKGNPKLTSEEAEQIIELKKTMTGAVIAERFNVTEQTIWNTIKKTTK